MTDNQTYCLMPIKWLP